MVYSNSLEIIITSSPTSGGGNGVTGTEKAPYISSVSTQNGSATINGTLNPGNSSLYSYTIATGTWSSSSATSGVTYINLPLTVTYPASTAGPQKVTLTSYFADGTSLSTITAFILGTPTPSTPAEVVGTVTISAFGLGVFPSPVPDATVKLSGNAGTYSTTTDNSGNYSLTAPAGSYTISATKYGFIGQSGTISLAYGSVSQQNFDLAFL